VIGVQIFRFDLPFRVEVRLVSHEPDVEAVSVSGLRSAIFARFELVGPSSSSLLMCMWSSSSVSLAGGLLFGDKA
jgi:hypothetical protein